MMTSQEIRQHFLDFFKAKGHVIVPSAPLVVKNDPSLMFINSGMAPFKDIFLGNKPIEHARVANTQKCLRVSGKHNDLEEVGVDTYHHTMFEMLGNWSFGDYFKQEAIAWSWELLVGTYKLDPSRVYVTVFEGDKEENLPFDAEAYQEWQKWMPTERILTGNKKDNFWEMGDTGPCGPCSEIHYDLRSDEERKHHDARQLINTGHPQVIEIWNLVFMQYERRADKSLKKLARQHVDTGMGFERLCMVIQQKNSNYDTDVFAPLIHQIEMLCGKKYQATTPYEAARKNIDKIMVMSDISMRVIADHVRAVAFTIADGQLPGNTGAGYVIRRILRRAVRYGYSYLHLEEPFLFRLVSTLAAQLGDVFPEMISQRPLIEKVMQEEESSFFRTLKKGMERLENMTETISTQNNIITGKAAFELFDTYGFPLDLTKLIATERGWKVDEEGFNNEMELQKNRSREATIVETADWIEINQPTGVHFVGYDQLCTDSRIIKYRKVVQKNKEFYQIVLDKTPFYAEGGGQLGDRGILIHNEETIQVMDTRRENDLIIHLADRFPQHPHAVYQAKVDPSWRNNITKNHSATHLLHAALRKVLGNHVEQRGSLVAPDYLRFDFIHPGKLTNEQIAAVENLVNEKILENIPLEEKRDIPLEEAKAMGAMALFGEKYGEKVRVIIFDPRYSIELCGGCHVKSTGQIGFFKIISESSVAAGIRRIEAITGKKAFELANQAFEQLSQIRAALNNTHDILKTIQSLKKENDILKKQLQQYEDKQLAQLKQKLLSETKKVGTLQLLIAKAVPVHNQESLRKLGLQLTAELGDKYIMMLSTLHNGIPLVHLRVAPGLGLNANQLLKELAPDMKGGGPPDFVQAHAPHITAVDTLADKLMKKITDHAIQRS